MAGRRITLVPAMVAAAALCQGALADASNGTRYYFRGAGQLSEADAQRALLLELDGHGARIRELEDGLGLLFAALPKNSKGHLEHQVVRYALHRFFLDRHGWFIRGLEPRNSEWAPENTQEFVKEWVPSFMQEILEKRGGVQGSNLHEVAAIAAALEDLIAQEGDDRLRMVYTAHGLDHHSLLGRSELDSVLTTYFMSFLIANNFTVGSADELQSKKSRFEMLYSNYSEANAWFQGVVSRTLEHRGLTISGGGQVYNFSAASASISEIGKNFRDFNELECADLRSTLQSFESRRPGRVRLSQFYNRSRYSHWSLGEKPEYLRSLGALDESDPRQPSVIIPNYVMARGNCLDAFHLYAICCRNACEDMMGHLEKHLGAPSAAADEIAGFIANVPSASVPAPRELPPALLVHLREVEALHGGKVPIHGRLFAQWMHHAYPLECPYPYEQGKANAQTAFEWMAQTGQDIDASEEQVREIVEADTCAVDWQGRSECEEETTDLPWTSTEELMVHADASPATWPPALAVVQGLTRLRCVGLLLGLLGMVGTHLRARHVMLIGRSQPWDFYLDKYGKMVAALFLIYGANLVSKLLIVVCMAFGFLMHASRVFLSVQGSKGAKSWLARCLPENQAMDGGIMDKFV